MKCQSLFFIFIFGCLWGQNSFIDSLNQAFSKTNNEEKKARILMEISDYWSYRDTTKAFSKLKEADIFIKENDFLKGLKLFYKAGIFYDKNIEKSEQLYMDAEKLLSQNTSREAYYYRAKLWHNYGVLQQMKGDIKSFLNITMEKCIPFAKKADNQELLLGYYVDMGMVFYNYKEYPKSISYYQQAIDIIKKENIKGENVAWAYINAGSSYLEMDKSDKVKESIAEAQKALAPLPHSQYNVLLHYLQARYYNAIGSHNRALISIQKGIDFAKEMNLDYDVFSLSLEKYYILKHKQNYTAAENLLKELLNIKPIGSKKNRLILLNEMADLQKKMGNYQEAYHFLEQFKQLNDSVQTENEKLQLLNLESKYKTKEHQKEIQLLEARNQQERIIFWASSILVVTIGAFFLYVMYQRKKKNEQKLLNIQQNKKLEINKALIYGENKERERIAKELHDGVAGRITAVKISLEHLFQENNDDRLLKSVNQLDEGLSELRQTISSLTPQTLHKFGLEEALKDFCQNMEIGNLKIYCYTNNLNKIKNQKQQLHIYRIIQEAVNNAVKHSGADKILMQCTLEQNILLMDIEDNGKGFDVENIPRNLGLDNIERRVNALNGILKIDSAVGRGTVISIEAKIYQL